jgi:hypothetical protein
MQGTTNSKALLKTSYSVSARGKVIAEWNHNIFSTPRMYGSFTSSSPSPFCELVDNGSYNTNSSLRSSTIFKSGSKYYSNSFNFLNLPKQYSPDTSGNKGSIISASNGDCFRVSFYGKTEVADADKIFIHVSEYLNSTVQNLGTFSRAFEVDPVDWSFHEFTFKVSSADTNKIRIDFSSEIAGAYTISDFTVVKITNDEFLKEAVLKVKSTFKGFRPGDEIAEFGSSNTKRVSQIIYQTGGNIRGKGNTRTYLPEPDSMTYYAEEVGSGIGVYGIYDKTISTNKIVLKLLNGAASETNFDNKVGTNYSLFTLSGTTWTEYAGSSLGNFNENGSLILYWNGNTDGWKTTKNTATLAPDGSSITGITNIDGIALRVSSLTSTSGDETVRFLEVSPRLILDLSDYLIVFSDSKELDSGNLPIPAGTSTANNASVTLENLPRSYSGSYFSIFSDNSSASPLSSILKKDVKFRISYDLIDSTGLEVETEIPFFVGYTDAWTANDVTAEITLFDYAKVLQDKKVRDILLLSRDNQDNNLKYILSEILERNGFSDYNISNTLSQYNLTTFYTDTQKTIWEVLQDVLLPYQHIAYFDNYGTLQIQSLANLSSGTTDFILTDIDRNGYISNINSLTIEKKEKPSQILVRYNHPSTKISPTIKDGDLSKNEVALKESVEVVWEASEPVGLGYSKISRTINDYDKEIYLDTSCWTDGIHGWTEYSGHLIVGSEMMKYDGIEIRYSLDGITILNATVKSSQEYKKFQNEIFDQQQITGNKTLSIVRTGKLMNVERGMYGTSAGTHYVAGDVPVSSVPVSVTNGLSVYSKTAKNSNTSGPLTLASYVKTDYHGKEKDNVLRLESNGGQQTMLCHAGDNNNFNTYEFTFAYPQDKQTYAYNKKEHYSSGINPHNENDFTGVFIGFDPASGSGIFIEFPLKGNTIHKKTALYFNKSKTATATSTFLMNLWHQSQSKSKKIINSVKPKTKKSKKKVVKKTVVVVEETETFSEAYQSIVIKTNGKKIQSVKVNKTNVNFKTSNKKTWSGDISSIDRDGKNFGIYVGPKTHVHILSMNAYNSNAVVMPGSSDTVDTANTSTVLGGGSFDNIDSPINFKSDSMAHGMDIYDIDFKTGPAFNQTILKPIGGYEIVQNNEKRTLFNITTSSTDASNANFTPYRAKFILINKSKSIVPTAGSSMSGLKISGNIIVKSDEMVYRKLISDTHKNSTSIEIASDWIQTEKNAKTLAKEIDKFIKAGLDTYNVNTFGNPLLEIGDIVNLYYSQSGINSDSRYIIIGLSNEFDGGFTTSVILRKIES